MEYTRTTLCDGKTPDNVLQRQKRHREKVGKEVIRERVRRSMQKRDKKVVRTYERERAQKARVQALMFLGGKCEVCGINDMRVLQIDHVNGGGTEENARLHSRGISRRVLEHPDDYQCLCANHNWIKRWERNENKQRVDGE